MSRVETKLDYDAIIIGAGVTGMNQTYLLDREGLRVLGIEAGEDVGGTWYWNRYPGCRLDTESYTYGYFALSGIIPEWDWSETFAGQPEMLRYANYAADKMDVRRHYKFRTKVVSAHYDGLANVWKVGLDSGEKLTCRFLISATGPLSASRMPDYAGIEDFTIHDLRHTAAVWMCERGTEMSKISTYMGHTKIDTTRIVYAQYQPDHVKDAAAALEV